jgi:hypothetical protein
MKNLWASGVLILVIIGVLYIIFLRECKTVKCPPNGFLLVKQSTWDSIKILANKPPVIKIDTFYQDRPVITPRPQPPLPKPMISKVDTTIRNYSDSLVNKKVKVWIDLKLKGTLLDRNWRYVPVTTEINQTETIFVPKIVDNPVPVSQRGFYLYGTAGGNATAFLFGGGLDYVTKNNTELGYMFQRFGTANFHSVKVGIKLFNKK